MVNNDWAYQYVLELGSAHWPIRVRGLTHKIGCETLASICSAAKIEHVFRLVRRERCDSVQNLKQPHSTARRSCLGDRVCKQHGRAST
jgi:hypothetical protein